MTSQEAMALHPSEEGDIPFRIPSTKEPCFTHYKVFGDLSCGKTPVVILHGGPGGGHEYLLPFTALWTRYGLPVVFYDQVGCAASTHLPSTAGDASVWNETLFIAELDNLLDHLHLRGGAGFHLYGHSWGGMLGAAFAGKRPRGLHRLVLASGLASMESCIRGVKLLRQQLAPDARDTLDKAEQSGEWDSPAVKEIQAVMASKHVCRVDPLPQELVPAFKHLAEDTTVYQTMYGLTWLAPKGTLSDWTCIPSLPQITAPTLVYNGEFDTSHDVATVPFFELIPRVRWITFANAGHMCHVEGEELREKVIQTVGDFLLQKP